MALHRARDASASAEAKAPASADRKRCASASRSGASVGRSCVCASSRYCSRCSSGAGTRTPADSSLTAARGSRPPRRAPRARASRCALTQRRLASAAHELQRLRDELDFADAAGPELDVALIALAASLLADLPMHVAQAVVGVVIEVLAETRTAATSCSSSSQRSPVKRPRLEPRVALPGPSLRDEVLLPAPRASSCSGPLVCRTGAGACRRGTRSRPR